MIQHKLLTIYVTSDTFIKVKRDNLRTLMCFMYNLLTRIATIINLELHHHPIHFKMEGCITFSQLQFIPILG